MDGILYIENFINDPVQLFDFLVTNISWDARMAARETASYGVAYNYSQISYPYQQLLPQLEAIINVLTPLINFIANKLSLKLLFRRQGLNGLPLPTKQIFCTLIPE